ncbi:glutamate--tRNA ligase [Reinekea marinisedimentorum]|uniref:Glutamate--tRNA ligase n=1 Tax=Reinekea marinisedimentorum TaxID=230495 RepID=A0A4R3I842_9GAMM|nr:glutamate--tRNA ligase [Reinekea marinisedimentorum]TCS41455.1 glutamyl-tRNA synthetase [Reinekea marinisedimentorum]
MTKIRTRIAPSPTGDPHVGTAYIALFNTVFAKSQGGEFILRIEDTDQARSTPESEQAILDSLKWLGLNWDEGPDVGGPHGPYRQSDRKEIYQQYTQQLIDNDHAFHCFCSAERLDEVREQQRANGEDIGYDGHCMSLTAEEVQQRLAAGEQSVVRMKVPEEGTCVIKDVLRGDVEIDWKQIDMQVLMKSDGLPTYHLASVVDDHLMEISHILRGEEWISSTPKQIALYQYFGWEPPVYVHLPLLRNADKSKLSKRKNPTSVTYYRELGILPEALVNFLGMMGWTMPNGEEIFTLEDMTQAFDVNRISLGGPVFDLEKLSWLNGKYLREMHTPEQLLQRLVDWKFNKEFATQLMPLAQTRAETLGDIAGLLSFFFQGNPPITAESFAGVKLEEDDLKRALQLVLWKLETQRHWEKDNIFADIKAVADHTGIKFRDLNAPIFIAITGSTASVSVMDAMAILGPDMTRGRLRHALTVLGGIGKKKLKSLEKDFRSMAEFLD